MDLFTFKDATSQPSDHRKVLIRVENNGDGQKILQANLQWVPSMIIPTIHNFSVIPIILTA